MAGEALVEAQLQSAIPGFARSGTTAQNATGALNMIRAEADRLGKNVTAAYQALKAEIVRVEAHIERVSAHRSAAEELFKKS